MSELEIAQACYACNREYCRSLNDYSLPLWKDTELTIKQGYKSAVLFHLSHPLATPKESHDLWMKSKTDAGWTFGPEKDTAKKQHPNILDYSLLTDEQKIKDIIFKSIVHALKHVYA